MPSVYDLKPKFQNLLRPITNGLARAGVTANHVTLAALGLSFATGGMLYFVRDRRVLLLLPLVLVVRMGLNAIDGMLAREHNQKTPLGAILNELGDVLSDAGLYLPLAFLLPFDRVAIVAIVLLATISEMTGVLGVQIGASRRYDGPMGKSDRAFVSDFWDCFLAAICQSLRYSVPRCGLSCSCWVSQFLIGRAALSANFRAKIIHERRHPSHRQPSGGCRARNQRRAGAMGGLRAQRASADLFCESHQPLGFRGVVVGAALLHSRPYAANCC